MKKSYVTRNLSLSEIGGTVESEFIDITFTNYGTGDLIVNDSIVIPGAPAGSSNFCAISGNENEIDVTKYKYRFSAAGTRIAIAVWREYTN